MLSQLSKTVHKRAKRLGRGYGSGAGAKSGRGTTRHQKARTKIPLHFEGGQNRMVKKYPLLRGKLKNKSARSKSIIISLSLLNTFRENDTINLDYLVEKGIIKNVHKERGVKVVANGVLEKKLTVELPVSQGARVAIEKAGGTVV